MLIQLPRTKRRVSSNWLRPSHHPIQMSRFDYEQATRTSVGNWIDMIHSRPTGANSLSLILILSLRGWK